MSSQDETRPVGEPAVPTPTRGPRPIGADLGARIRIWLLILGLAMLAGVAAWLVGESTFDRFQPSEEAASQNYDFQALGEETARASGWNGALAFGALGGLLGLALGLAGGLSRRSWAGALLGGIVGLLLGTAAGALPALTIMPWQSRHRNDDPGTLFLLMPLLVHLGLWSGAGLAAGLAFGLGNSGFKPARLAEAAIAGLVGAMLGTFVFEMAGGFFFPMARTAEAFSATTGTRLLARLCVAGFVGLGAIRSLPSNPPPDGEEKGTREV